MIFKKIIALLLTPIFIVWTLIITIIVGKEGKKYIGA